MRIETGNSRPDVKDSASIKDMQGCISSRKEYAVKIDVDKFQPLWLRFTKGELSQKEMMRLCSVDHIRNIYAVATTFRSKYGKEMFPEIDYAVIPENKATIEFWENRHKYTMAERQEMARELGYAHYGSLTSHLGNLRRRNVKVSKGYMKGISNTERYYQFIEKLEEDEDKVFMHTDLVGWLKQHRLIEPEFVACGG